MSKLFVGFFFALSLSCGAAAVAGGHHHSGGNSYGGYGGGYGGGYNSGFYTPHHSVDAYYRSNGTYVPQHYRTNQNNTQMDNWISKPNVNPYTGKRGYRTPEY